MYPYGDLPGNLAAFCDVLRREHGFRIGPGELRDAARALEAVDLTRELMARLALRLVLSSSRETAQAFDRAFDRFFFPGPAGIAQTGLPGATRERPASPSARETGERTRPSGHPDAEIDPDLDAASDAALVMSDDSEAGDEAGRRVATARYSPVEAEGQVTLRLNLPTPAWRDAARLLIRRLQLGLSRRWRPARSGRRFDLRRTWRASLQTGGEAIVVRWLRRVRRSPRVVLLIDGSRSMEASQATALDLAVALTGAAPRVEVFVFSTALTRLTRDVRLAGAGRARQVTLERATWGGGTSIGASLGAFLRRHGERLVTRDTLAVIVSDGLDVGESGPLQAAMRELHRRTAGVVWLNPLLATPGYEPTSRGMRAARPFITTFAHVGEAADLVRLSRRLRLR